MADATAGTNEATICEVADGAGPSARVWPWFMRWPVFVLMLAGAYVIAALFVGFTRSGPSDAGNAQISVSDTHCAEFIALARSTFGNDWRYRLDPRDTTCAREVQEEWDRQSGLPRQPRAPEPLPPSIFASPTRPPAIQDTVDTETTLPPLAETQCLNVISLARAKYGPEWANQVAPADAARCAGPIQKSLGR